MLSKETTLITGASSGIGLELAHIFARNKSDLVLVARNEKRLLALKTELETKYGIDAHVIAADLSLPQGTATLVEEVKKNNLEVGVLVNNAGFGAFGDFATETEWQKEKEMLQVNIVALTELCKAFVPDMVKRMHGKILNVASTAAFQPGPLMAVYYASKAYVLHFSEAIAEELSGTGVTVTALCPGATESGFQDAAAMHDSALVKNKKLPTSQEVAEYAYTALYEGKRVAIHGFKNSMLANSVRFAPRNIAVKIARKIQERTSS